MSRRAGAAVGEEDLVSVLLGRTVEMNRKEEVSIIDRHASHAVEREEGRVESGRVVEIGVISVGLVIGVGEGGIVVALLVDLAIIVLAILFAIIVILVLTGDKVLVLFEAIGCVMEACVRVRLSEGGPRGSCRSRWCCRRHRWK